MDIDRFCELVRTLPDSEARAVFQQTAAAVEACRNDVDPKTYVDRRFALSYVFRKRFNRAPNWPVKYS